MPYDLEALKTNEFYQNLVREDEKRYVNLVRKKLLDGDTTTGTLRDQNTGNIILFESVVPGQGSNGLSFNPTRLTQAMDRKYLSKAKKAPHRGKKKKDGKNKKGSKNKKRSTFTKELMAQSMAPAGGNLHTIDKTWDSGYFVYDTLDEKIIDKEFTEL